MTKATRIERLLIDGAFGDAVLTGMRDHKDSRAMVRMARDLWSELRERVGYQRSPADLLTSGASQQKLGKNKLPSFGLMLLPEKGLMSDTYRDIRRVFGITGPINLCPMASKGCAAACLSRSGQSGMRPAQRAQAVRTAFVLSHPAAAGLLIGDEIRRALRKGPINLRLNTTSDIRWELVSPKMVQALADAGVTLYDYTAWKPFDREVSSAYSLTYSAKEPSHTSDQYLKNILRAGGNVAMPFTTARGEALPTVWHGFAVIDGDKSDERWADPRGVVVGLRAKGHEWKRDNSAGFIRTA